MDDDRRSFLKTAALAIGATALALPKRALVAVRPTDEQLDEVLPEMIGDRRSWYDMVMKARVHELDKNDYIRREWIGDDGRTLKIEFCFKQGMRRTPNVYTDGPDVIWRVGRNEQT